MQWHDVKQMIPHKAMFLSPENFLASVSFGTIVSSAMLYQMSAMYWVLLALIAIDVLTGIAAGIVMGSLESSHGWKGVVKKSISLGIVIALDVSAQALKGHTGGFELPAGEFVAAMFCFQELISITENADRAGVWVPGPVKQMLKRLKTVIDMQEQTVTETTKVTDIHTTAVKTTVVTETAPPVVKPVE